MANVRFVPSPVPVSGGLAQRTGLQRFATLNSQITSCWFCRSIYTGFKGYQIGGNLSCKPFSETFVSTLSCSAQNIQQAFRYTLH